MSAQRGFTLVELMTTISVVAILTVLGIPSYRSVTTINRISSEVNQLVGDLQYARAEAIRQGQNVVICTIANPSSATPACGGTSSWQNGWFIFTDINGTGTYQSGDVLLRQETPFTGGPNADTLQAIGSPPANPTVASLSFNRNGFSGTTGESTFRFHDVRDAASFTRCISVSLVGYITIENVGSGACS